MSILSDNLATKIQYVVRQSITLSKLDHAGIKGRLRELLVSHLIEPLLPDGVSVTTGTLIDSKGTQSKQQDIIIYASDMLPPILRIKELSIIPVDAALHVIEVKSKLDANEVKDCLKKAVSVKSLFLLGAGDEYPPPLNGILHNEFKHRFRVETIFSVFAFGSDLKGTGKTEWDRYRELAKASPDRVKIDDLCVVGSGYWNGNSCPEGLDADENYNEVLSMLIPLLNSLPLWRKARGTPQLSQYFTDSD